ncbi:hypothetical protein CSB45_14780 [candidate division KSB3 bacterium]|uniref:Cadherin domain-containing protein n=1 Tax=candidate division KSB3 bacterium TaxID=2044937 RepID=A0A2G6E0W0_9BACT|nr:MAG: hypothetical protein CSB45_14780 [candidate division KSB3 bacterium]PIE31088.1 MAG: hypothetical protein CSA57_00295 [candidate division KSB3 bacterium]
MTIEDSTYTSGRFGFFNHSQAQVHYNGFIRQTILEPAYRYDVNATDSENDPLTYTRIINPEGMVVNPDTGGIVWDPTGDDVGEHPVEVLVEDGYGGSDTQSFVVAVTEESNTNPIISSMPDTVTLIDKLYAYTIEAIDPDSEPLNYSLFRAPDGMSIDSDSGLISWTPAAGQLGEHAVKVIVEDGRGAGASQSSSVYVNSANMNPPQITSTPMFTSRVEQEYLYAVEATDADGDPLSYSLSIAPDGMKIDPDSGLIRWTPQLSQTGSYDVKIIVDDGQGGIGGQQYRLTILPPNEAADRQPVTTGRGRAF